MLVLWDFNSLPLEVLHVNDRWKETIANNVVSIIVLSSLLLYVRTFYEDPNLLFLSAVIFGITTTIILIYTALIGRKDFLAWPHDSVSEEDKRQLARAITAINKHNIAMPQGLGIRLLDAHSNAEMALAVAEFSKFLIENRKMTEKSNLSSAIDANLHKLDYISHS